MSDMTYGGFASGDLNRAAGVVRTYDDECVRAVGSVQSSITVLQHDLERLHKASMVLVEMIGPVLGPDHPRPTEMPRDSDGTGCDLADVLRTIDRDVEIVIDRLTNATERVQL